MVALGVWFWLWSVNHTSKWLLIHSCSQNQESSQAGVSLSVPTILKVPSLHRENTPNPPRYSSEVNVRSTQITSSFQLTFGVSKGNAESAYPGRKLSQVSLCNSFPSYWTWLGEEGHVLPGEGEEILRKGWSALVRNAQTEAWFS